MQYLLRNSCSPDKAVMQQAATARRKSMHLPGFIDVVAAAARLKGLAIRTPLLWNPALDEVVGGRVLVKAECLQRTGSFKFRGAYNAISLIPETDRSRGVVAFSSGNHAQGIAEAARLFGIPATIVMPADAPAIKAQGVTARGGRVVTYDRTSGDREAISRRLCEEAGATLIPSFDHFGVIAGQGTCGLEITQQLEEMGEAADQLVCCVGGGGCWRASIWHLRRRPPALPFSAPSLKGLTIMRARWRPASANTMPGPRARCRMRFCPMRPAR